MRLKSIFLISAQAAMSYSSVSGQIAGGVFDARQTRRDIDTVFGLFYRGVLLE